MSSFFPRGSQGERGQKCSVFLFGQIKSREPLPVLRDEFPTEFGSQTKTKKKNNPTSCYRLSFGILYHNSLATAAVPMYGSCLSPAVVPVYSVMPSTALLKLNVGAAFSANAVRCPLTARPGCVLHAIVCRCQVSPTLLLAEGIPCRDHLSPLHYGWSRLQCPPPPFTESLPVAYCKTNCIAQTASCFFVCFDRSRTRHAEIDKLWRASSRGSGSDS